MSWLKLRDGLKRAAILFWMAFTVAFALWWYKFSMQNISLLAALEPTRLDHWQRQMRMVFWEGGTWMLLLVLGGVALFALFENERRHALRIKEFFASFTHEVKTSLASLRLQAEALKDDMPSSPILDRLIGDTVRLQLQLENSLFLSSQENLKVYLQPVALEEMFERMREQWPGLGLQFNQKCVVRADERALRTILSNLMQNAIIHGRATSVSVKVQVVGPGRVSITVRDNGIGFEGPKGLLGGLFYRPKSTSGSGLGLYISRLLMQKMHGELRLADGSEGFQVELQMNGSIP